MTHRCEAKFCVSHTFECDVIGVLVDALQRLAAAATVAQLRRVVVGTGGPGIELVRSAQTQRLELRLQLTVLRVTQVQLQQAPEIRIDAEEVDAPAIGDVLVANGLANDWFAGDVVHAGGLAVSCVVRPA